MKQWKNNYVGNCIWPFHLYHSVISAGRVRSRFGELSDSTGPSYRLVTTQSISLSVGSPRFVIQPIFRPVGFEGQSDPTGSGWSSIIVKPDSIGFKYYQVRLDRFDGRFGIVTYKCYKFRLETMICTLQCNRNIDCHMIYN